MSHRQLINVIINVINRHRHRNVIVMYRNVSVS